MLVHVVTSANRQLYLKQLEEMHRLRHRVFVEAKGWSNLHSPDGLEIDDFDHAHAVYLVAIDDVGEVAGALRLIPTCAPHLMSSCLRDYVGDLSYVAPFAWEFSRWMPGAIGKRRTILESRPRLLTAVIEFALSRNVESFVAVCETRRLSTFAEMGWEVSILGEPQQVEQDRRAVAVRWRLSRRDLAFARKYFGFDQAVSFEAPCVLDDAELTPLAASALSELWSLRERASISSVLEHISVLGVHERVSAAEGPNARHLLYERAEGRA